MSFLIEVTARRVATAVPRASILSWAPRANFTGTATGRKSVVDSAKDTLKAVDRKVGDKVVGGIEAGERVAGKLKDTASEITRGNISGKTADLRGDAKEMAGEAKGMAKEYMGDMKGKAQEYAGDAKETAKKAARKVEEAAGNETKH